MAQDGTPLTGDPDRLIKLGTKDEFRGPGGLPARWRYRPRRPRPTRPQTASLDPATLKQKLDEAGSR